MLHGCVAAQQENLPKSTQYFMFFTKYIKKHIRYILKYIIIRLHINNFTAIFKRKKLKSKRDKESGFIQPQPFFSHHQSKLYTKRTIISLEWFQMAVESINLGRNIFIILYNLFIFIILKRFSHAVVASYKIISWYQASLAAIFQARGEVNNNRSIVRVFVVSFLN